MSLQPCQESREDLEVEEIVVRHLQTHPEFFERHQDLLSELRIPHPTGLAVSLLERQVQALRSQRARLDRKLKQLLEVARENDALYAKMQELTLALLDAKDPAETLAVLEEGLRSDFRADFVELRLIPNLPQSIAVPAPMVVSASEPLLEAFQNFFNSKRAVCGRLLKRQLQFLFAQAASEVGSACLVPLRSESFHGLLAIGSRDRERFQPEMGTLFLTHLGEVVSRVLQVLCAPTATDQPLARSSGDSPSWTRP